MLQPTAQVTSGLAEILLAPPRPGILVPLVIFCAAILITIPAAARRGKLHMPGYAAYALLAFLVAIGIGYLSGRHGIRGTAAGVVLGFVFFGLIAAVIGCILALAFYRGKPEEQN
jgi:hypothetical protein